MSVFLSSSELCQELKCQILALFPVYTIACSDAASGLAAWYVGMSFTKVLSFLQFNFPISVRKDQLLEAEAFQEATWSP